MFLNHSSPHAAKLTTICRRKEREITESISIKRERKGDLIWAKKMGSEGGARKLRLLCLHGFRTSGEIFKKQVTGKWPESVLEKLDLVFTDAPFPCQGKSDVEGIFDPPYYEWFQFNEEFSEYVNFDECLAYIEDFMIKHGPFDGLLGFSQGAILSGGLAGMQANGVALKRLPKLKLVVIIGGAKFRNQSMIEKAYSAPIQCRSVHFLGDQDFFKERGTELLDSFIDPLVIRHPKGHTIPRFDEKGLESMLSFLEKMQKEVA
ncbi:esterase AGAP003155-like [Salvia hispanica]|uniref:esterase AGAP003155-like n=1 Tax=Salvia hispanica TaxID=49212 RepID=UPI002009C41A|nr:esterase AGAP003155-like [Salvia hispanica]